MDEKFTQKHTQANSKYGNVFHFSNSLAKNDKSDWATEIKSRVRNKSFAIIGNIYYEINQIIV